MNSNQLQYFSVMYEKRSLSAAAKTIPMSHQGLTKAIDKLEAELGVRLFEASGSSSMPTRYADLLYEFGQEYARLRQKMSDDFARIDAMTKGELRLGASTGIFGFLGEEFIKGFSTANSNIKIARMELPDLICDETLKSRSYDIALTVYPFDDDFTTMEMYRTERCVWVSRDDPLANKETLTFNDLAGYEVGTMGPAFKNYTNLVSILERKSVQPVSIECAAEMFWLCKFAEQVGRASFTVPHIVEFFKDNRAIVGKPIIGIPWGFGISWCKGYKLNEAERQFVDYCVQYSSSHSSRQPKQRATRLWL
ncbi:MAG: LysR family transcriptional regulator [Coriobacteriales bacterium]|jgi:DNA-binding transcriptional LysR family regulator|nr:LysR family transcriptional regulator [Coriobacteriales bacterium]